MEHSYKEVKDLDDALYDLASYETLGGLILKPVSQEEMFDLYSRIITTFNMFKRSIQNGECTFEFIKEGVLARNGAFPRQKITDEEIVEQTINNVFSPVKPIENKLSDPRTYLAESLRELADSLSQNNVQANVNKPQSDLVQPQNIDVKAQDFNVEDKKHADKIKGQNEKSKRRKTKRSSDDNQSVC